jgi:hypothetical protein
MNKYILVEHLTTWCKWKNVNLSLDVEESHQEKSKKRFGISYRAITDHFGSDNPYKNDDAQPKTIHGKPTIVCCQSLHAYFYYGKSIVEAFGHASKSPSCAFKLKANGSTCHPFIGGQYHVTISNNFGFMYYNNNLFDLSMSKYGHNTFALVINFIHS